MIYPRKFNLIRPPGCGCVDGCSSTLRCSSANKNGGQFPFDRNGATVDAKPLVYECGPRCGCPLSCFNQVSQHGIKFQLEVFKTKSKGWVVRALTSIPSGRFVCEYTGELSQATKAEERTTNDEYLFDIGNEYNDHEAVEDNGFTIEATRHENDGGVAWRTSEAANVLGYCTVVDLDPLLEADPVTKKPDFLTFYKDMHYTTNKGWIAPLAEQNYEKMVEMANQPTKGESTPKTVEEIRSVVLGERPSYTPGLGYGMVPKTRGVRVASIAAVTAATFGQMEDLRNIAESSEHELHQMREEHQQLKEQQIAHQQQLDLIMTQMRQSTGPWMNMLTETIN